MTKLTKVGSKVWVLPSDVVRVYYTKPTVIADKTYEDHVYVVLRSPKGGTSFGLGDGDHYQVTDWPLVKVERALGLRPAWSWPDSPVFEYFAQWRWTLRHVWTQLRGGVGA